MTTDETPRNAAPAFSERLRFTGIGSEYFRIWVVNLLLTLLTLGVYSAWAKVRKARWFAQHTELMGDCFDFHGQPLRILLGRVMSVGLVVLWTWSFAFALWFGLAVLLLFCIVGPWLFASAQRFRLANTSWRGLRFAFDVPVTRVYLVCVPLLLLWAMAAVLESAGLSLSWIAAATGLTLLGFPWAHARLKQMQHAHASFGTQAFSFEPSNPAFYALYAKAVLLAITVLAVLFALVALVTRVVRDVSRAELMVTAVWIGGLGAILVWLFSWPYFAARMQQVVWSRTCWGGVRFRGDMKGWRLWRLVLGQTALVLLSAGLYWPFAAVAVARYRIESIVVEADAPIADIEMRAGPAGGGQASGDASADLFGLDLGW